MKESNVIRLGTRGSLLAKAQSEMVAAELGRLSPGVRIELCVLRTTGDRIVDRPLHDVGGKGLFTKELEIALLNGEIDFAVHSYKDVPVTMPLVDVSGLVIAAVPRREDVRDVLVASAGIRSISDLPIGARVGTGSLRRECQLLSHRPDLKVVPIRGNIDTRLRKQREGEVDAVVLAAAGLRRARLSDAAEMSEISVEQMVPAAAQGALAMQCRKDDQVTRKLLGLMNDGETETCVNLEREVIGMLNADCHSPIGVFAEKVESTVTVRIAIGEQGSTRIAIHKISAHVDLIIKEIHGALFK